jgi:hypothetical protein
MARSRALGTVTDLMFALADVRQDRPVVFLRRRSS